MSVVIVDYGSGNLRSAAKAFERAAAEYSPAQTVTVSSDPRALRTASHIVLPGQGAFADCKRGLSDLPGMIEALEESVVHGGKPFLGICVGMQLMARTGHEHGEHEGLGWIEGKVVPIEAKDPSLWTHGKIPHMGWNDLKIIDGSHPVFKEIETGRHAYFVHSYRFVCDEESRVLAAVDYGGPIAAAVGRDNMVGTQFHPDKSQATGLKLIANFLEWRP